MMAKAKVKSDVLSKLKEWGACEDGYLWTKDQGITSMPELWAKLQRPDWMLWIAEKQCLKLDESRLRLFACDCAEQSLPFYERDHPDDKRPRHAIETARRFANGQATAEELAAAGAAAWAAAWDAARAAAWDAAWDAARAAARAAARDAARAAAWAAARDAARAAARDAAWAAAWDAAGAYQVDRLRLYFPNPFEE